LKVENQDFICEIKELKKCEGEASANNRKAKLVFLVGERTKAEFVRVELLVVVVD
jgi:hypothetical protein